MKNSNMFTEQQTTKDEEDILFLESMLEKSHTLESKIEYLILKEKELYHYFMDCPDNFTTEEINKYHEVWYWIVNELNELNKLKINLINCDDKKFYRVIYNNCKESDINNYVLPSYISSGWYALNDSTKDDIINLYSLNQKIAYFQFSEGYGKEIETIEK